MTELRVYGAWAGNPAGHKESTAHCIAHVYNQFNGHLDSQCRRLRGHGPGGLYCKQHGKREQDRRARASSHE